MELQPNTQKILKIFDPTTFPIEISDLFLREATAQVANSGKEVPSATIVNPMSDSLMPKVLAK